MERFDLNCCRICLSYCDLISLFSIDDKITLSEKVMLCASVQILENDGLPGNICGQCKRYLDSAYVFKTVCEFTNMKLKEALSHQDLEEGEIIALSLEECETSVVDELTIAENVVEECADDSDITESLNNVSANSDRSMHIEEFLVLKDTLPGEPLLNGMVVSAEDVVDKNECPNVAVGEKWSEHDTITSNDEVYVDKLLNLDINEVYVYSNIENSYSAQLTLETEPSSGDLQRKNQGTNTTSLSKEMIERNKVGRHVAKKIAGQHPRKLQRERSSERDENKVSDDLESMDVGVRRTEASTDVQECEFVVPEPVFEETVVTNEERLDVPKINGIKIRKKAKTDKKKRLKLNCRTSTASNLRKRSRVKIKLNGAEVKEDLSKDNTATKHNSSGEIKVNTLESTEDMNGGNRDNLNVDKPHVNHEGKLICNVCKKSFPYRSHLLRHLNTHTGLKQHTCEHCHKAFVNHYNLSEHLRKHTGNFPLKCEICGKGFSSPSVLKRHMRSHNDEFDFQCKYCHKRFRHSSSLQLHEKMHLHKPSYKCDICFKIFSYTNSLVAHRKTHAGFKPHSCTLCNKSFTRRTSLLRHVNCHASDKKLKCNVCSETFTSTNTFVVHMKIHLKHECDICKMVFVSRSLLANHLKKHGLKCEHCAKKFDNRLMLVKHIQRHALS